MTGVAEFRGPYGNGPPPDALVVDPPPLAGFGGREIRRMVVIYVVLVVSVVRAVVRRLRTPRSAAWPAVVSTGLVDGFEILGPTFVKLGQLVASSPGVFPAPLADACLRCLDEVPPFDPATARRLVEENLGRPPEAVFRTFDDRPLSAASIGQVHACTLPDGRAAVIKLQRPDIAHRMNTDLRILYRLARTLERRTRIGRTANAVAVIEDLHAVTNQELNAALEAHRQTQFRDGLARFGDNRWVTAPEVHWDYCGPHLICMERMSGVPMDEFDILRARGIDGELALRRAVKGWMEALMIHGPFHGDIHAGNLWFLDDGRVSFLDFGIMGELTEEWKQLLRDLFATTMIDNDFARLARAFKRVGAFPEDVGSDEEVGVRIGMLFGPMLDLGLSGVSLGEVLKAILAMMEQFAGATPRELVLITKQLLYFERYARTLAPDWVLARDLFLVKNILAEAPAHAARVGVTFPD
jgi:predicted unusual protein kinase regulating ubiquinone biosynthesis (AarF/ABC1/UbiB family)